MRAAWGARLVDRVNELCAATSPGMLAREGLGGTGTEPIPTSRRLPRASAAIQPWTFVCKKSEGEDGKEKREGGWVNCKVQIGYKLIEVTEGIDKTDDGTYLCVCDLTNDTAKVVVIDDDADYAEGYDINKNTLSFYVGTVEDGEQKSGPHMHPVAYKVL